MTRLLSRRMVLRGFAGLAIGLPLLEATHGKLWAQNMPTGPKRFFVFFEHGGNICPYDVNGRRFTQNGSGPAGDDGNHNWIDHWKPASAPGQPLVLGRVHQKIAQHADSIVVLRGVDNRVCYLEGSYNGGHRWANASALASNTMTEINNDFVAANGPSIDQALASRLAMRNPARFASIDLEVPSFNYGTPFFRAARQPLDSECNPKAAFDRLFAGVTNGAAGPDPAVVRARALRRSVLDGTTTQLRALRGSLSGQDVQAIDAHLEHIRSIETRLDAQAVPLTATCTRPTVTGFDGHENWDYCARRIREIGPLMVDIMLAAFRCGLSNVGTLNIGDIPGNTGDDAFLNPPIVTDNGHSLHHMARDVGPQGATPALHDRWLQTILINRDWRMGLLGRFLDGLKATPEGPSGASMLDNSLLLWTSEFSNGSVHGVVDMPILLIGKAGGRLRTGRHINLNLAAQTNPDALAYQTRSSLHNLYTWVLNAFDYPDQNFGSTGHAWYEGPLTGLA